MNRNTAHVENLGFIPKKSMKPIMNSRAQRITANERAKGLSQDK